MSGHSHWAGIKHKKALVDNKRGRLWSKLSKAIIVAAKAGGGDVDTNLKLRYAIDEAKAVSMPKENIQRAIKKGTGELEGGNLDELMYEGYGAGGSAVIAEVLTDNRNRTAPEIRKIFEVCGGKMGNPGCVAFMFDRKGQFHIPVEQMPDEDAMTELVLDLGGEDCTIEEDYDDNDNLVKYYNVLCSIDDFGSMMQAFTDKGLHPTKSQMVRIASNTVELGLDDARKALKLFDRLDEHDDVQNVFANFVIPEDVQKQLDAEEE